MSIILYNNNNNNNNNNDITPMHICALIGTKLIENEKRKRKSLIDYK